MTNLQKLHERIHKLGEFTISCFLTTVAKMTINIAKNIILTRFLGPEARGAFGVLNTTPSIIVSFGNLGFGLGTVFLIAKKKADLSMLTGNALLYIVFHGILLTCAGTLLILYGGSLLYTQETIITAIIPFMIAGVPLLLAQNMGSDILLGTQDIHYLNLISIASTLFPLLALIIFWFITGNLLLSASWAWLGSMIIVAAMAFRHIIKQADSISFSMPLIKEAFSFGLRGNVSQFANAIVRKVDILFLTHYSEMKEVGFYVAAVSISELLLTLPTAISDPFMPLIIEMEKEEGQQFSSLLIKYVLVFMTAICILIALLSKPIILLLFGKAFLPSLAPLLWLLPGMLPLSLYQFLKADMYRLNRPGIDSWTSAIAMVTNIILNFMLIPKYGISGAAIASSVSYAFSTGLLFIFYCKLTQTPIKKILFITSDDLNIIKNMLLNALNKRFKRIAR